MSNRVKNNFKFKLSFHKRKIANTRKLLKYIGLLKLKTFLNAYCFQTSFLKSKVHCSVLV